jgi:hypothetical protein
MRFPAADAALSFCASASWPIWDAQNPPGIGTYRMVPSDAQPGVTLGRDIVGEWLDVEQDLG